MIAPEATMTAATAAKHETTPGLAPFVLKDAPSFIEAQFPVGRLSAEAYKERKANLGQTLTGLGSYWKGRKPLILVRAVVLGTLLPATDNPAKELDIFLKLMGMDDGAFVVRLPLRESEVAEMAIEAGAMTEADLPSYFSVRQSFLRRLGRDEPFEQDWAAALAARALIFDTDEKTERRLRLVALSTLPYAEKVRRAKRPEECDEAELLADIWPEVNRHLGTNAFSIPELIAQLGIARFGQRPKVADTFCGGGSIPFEAVRMGCDVYASDLNPIACMLTWGAFNIIGASRQRRAEIERAQKEVAAAVDAEITRLGIEHDNHGNRAKAFLYCLETRCPKTGWMVPMAPSWVISKTRRVVAKLVPDHAAERYEIEVHSGVSPEEMAEAEQGTVRDGRLVHPMNPERSGVDIRTIRGDYRDTAGVNRNRLRLWESSNFVPRPDDIYQERLYAIQWITKESLDKGQQETFFAAVTDDDVARERQVETLVRENLARWQDEGLVPDMRIEPGDETTRLFRERGWTYWHHLFSPRDLLNLSSFKRHVLEPSQCVAFPIVLNHASKMCQWITSLPRRDKNGKQLAGPRDLPNHVFYNQALNLFWNYALRASTFLARDLFFVEDLASYPLTSQRSVSPKSAHDAEYPADLFVTDPPYADAVNYHEITEFFISWLRKNPPSPFNQWTWDSRRDLAIKGKDETFRRDMVAAYAAMTRHMPDNGVQVVMFTHQDAGVWADLGAILWAAGLRVTAAWNVVTETESALKAGNYVQGTVCLVLRKRLTEANARRMEIEAEIEDAVASSSNA
jgi:putative DNA methylase